MQRRTKLGLTELALAGSLILSSCVNESDSNLERVSSQTPVPTPSYEVYSGKLKDIKPIYSGGGLLDSVYMEKVCLVVENEEGERKSFDRGHVFGGKSPEEVYKMLVVGDQVTIAIEKNRLFAEPLVVEINGKKFGFYGLDKK
jgi:hypothetical protein